MPKSHYRFGRQSIVRCRQGHLFSTIWVPFASLKAVRLGPWRFQWCPVGRHWTLVHPVNVNALSPRAAPAGRGHPRRAHPVTRRSPRAQPNRLQRLMRRSGGTRAGSWVYIRALHRVDRPIFRLTRGRHTLTSLLTGLPIGVLETTGARSGRPRHSPLLIYPTSAGQMVIASNYGQARHPAWYHNLLGNPEARLVLGGDEHMIRARRLEGDTRDRIWHEAVLTYPGLKAYERWSGNRHIPILLLEPVSQSAQEAAARRA